MSQSQPTDRELDTLERQVPRHAWNATHNAYTRALAASPEGVLCVESGNLVRVSQDGEKVVVGKAKPRRKVKVGEVITVRLVERTSPDAQA
ncbi:hypothetical protein ACIP1T_24935 [Pseudomonas japonica]|uniref:hypothetical protein n=1 Tax=Pseudomonas TaxID=286 RepID=UPI002927B289|nr:hypothetical protein [Pseudomonas sp. zfem002]MDU9390007.1 hypothetical protein [Pseudomonas sp. zfem002]